MAKVIKNNIAGDGIVIKRKKSNGTEVIVGSVTNDNGDLDLLNKLTVGEQIESDVITSKTNDTPLTLKAKDIGGVEQTAVTIYPDKSVTFEAGAAFTGSISVGGYETNL